MSNTAPLFNYEFGLSQLGGNKALLDKMLNKFVIEFEQNPAEIQDAINQNDFEKAKIRVHTTKGIAGNLGLQALYKSSSEFDAELREKKFSDESFAHYSQIMVDTCKHIRELDLDQAPGRVDMVETGISKENGKATLLKRLERSEFIDDDSLVELVSSIKLDDSDGQRLIVLIEELKYAEAIQLIRAT